VRSRTLAAVALVTAVTALAAGAAPPPVSTLGGTIVDRNRDGRLEAAAGERRTLRVELATPQPGRESRRRSLLFFGHMTDFQLVDEESPARVELVDRYGGSLDAAYRPQEGLLPFVVEASVRQLRKARSTAGRPLELVVVTGDNADNTQLNETRWTIDLLDGGVVVSPDSGTDPGTCRVPARGRKYQGVKGGGFYYDPDRNGRGTDGAGYARLPNRPGLFELMQRPFRATGLGVPWYSVFGNHDGLVQGNVAYNDLFALAAIGCVKPVKLSQRGLSEIGALLAGGLTSEERSRLTQILARDLVETVFGPQLTRGRWVPVLRDERRRLLRQPEWIAEHFRTRGRPAGHGFTHTGAGYYAFSPRAGVRFVAIDTVADSGDQGNVDDAQFRWLDAELADADARGDVVILLGHHPLASLTNAAPGVHLGLGDCASTPEPVGCLLLRHPSVKAIVMGHAHRNRVVAHRRAAGGGFWEIVTAAHTDWPQQARTLELLDNGDGTLSILATVVDHAAPARPGPRPRRAGALLSAREVEWLASVARELAWNDPHNPRDERRGTLADRNVELVVSR
jgi:metallophosphoesterase (TIGR03767 family)